MATNVYFSQKVRSEQNLYEDIVIESLKMYGQDVYYLPREVVQEDTILNEDIESTFNSAYTIEMYIANIDGFEGDGNLLSKFGVEIRDQANFIVSRKRWNQYIAVNEIGSSQDNRPKEGDLVYLPLSRSLFEVKFVEHESPFYQLSNLPTYTLQCELFEYSGEQLETGINEIDDIMDDIGHQLVLVVDSSNGIDFAIGETIAQQIGTEDEYVTATVLSQIIVDSNVRKLYVTNWATSNGEYHEFTLGSLIGLDTNAQWNISEIYDIDDPIEKKSFVNDLQSRNQEIELEADGIIDFTESNPFGDLGV